jgi:hypothetical protein
MLLVRALQPSAVVLGAPDPSILSVMTKRRTDEFEVSSGVARFPGAGEKSPTVGFGRRHPAEDIDRFSRREHS